MQRKYLTKEQALQKLRHYCAYQERSHYEVQQKLFELGIRKPEQDEIISSLIEDDYLNEERFAIQFAGGKFRMNDWGRKKIRFALKEKRVSDYNINKALHSIDEEEYEKTVQSLAEKKYATLKDEPYLERKKKTTAYLLQKGYELEIINKAISYLSEN
ncbi:MAG: RecX family transcriptional regulator [Flavisolibacter sp.]|nr:RecX family transcriptional regulator [Flavisolibacter sp.]MBD0287127.1 RecX family transcriptional regulator [Flavisolibacter sp.]MBD0349811.1 RecX family transcriptional regulator [Flavisolibacter sp.]MBD0364753.1 RecX family transcriptional regulator [Flavisolibacter sp.]